ncbi:MAG TPA: hypothetical protein VF690_12550, partial [Hymenobacter sp.]
ANFVDKTFICSHLNHTLARISPVTRIADDLFHPNKKAPQRRAFLVLGFIQAAENFVCKIRVIRKIRANP